MRYRRISIVVGIFVLLVLYIITQSRILNQNVASNTEQVLEAKSLQNTVIYIAVVACGSRLQETLVLIKSALLFNHTNQLLRFLIFAEDHLMASFTEKLSDWRNTIPNLFEYEIFPVRFPVGNAGEWRNLFKPCAAQRLFLPSVLSSIDSLLYVDTDVLFLSPVFEIWQYFKKFNDTQLAALTPEHEDEHSGWYNRFARHPYYGRLGVNSGVMLMNLTRMRQFNWEMKILPIYKEYKLRITWGDQDLINILFYFYPESLYIMPCVFNYRPDHCMYMSVCNASNGIKVVHGNRGYFHSNKQPLFRAIFETIEKYQLGTSPYRNFLAPLKTALEEPAVAESTCGKMTKEVLHVAQTIFKNNYDYDYNDDN